MNMETTLFVSHDYAAEAEAASTSFGTQSYGVHVKFSRAEIRCVAARENIFAEGDAARAFFEIKEGAVMILRNLPGGRRQILNFAGPRQFIGLTAGAEHDCAAVALRDTTFARHDRLQGSQSSTAGVDLAKIMYEEIHRLRDLATALGRKTALERLAGFLLTMIDHEAEAPINLALPVSRQEIADHLGLVIETVCRNITALKRRGIIGINGNFGLAIYDIEALRQIAGNGSVWAAAG
jgi:CRP-like cAMP-binding protein